MMVALPEDLDRVAPVSLERYYVRPTAKVLGIFASEVAPCFPVEGTRMFLR